MPKTKPDATTSPGIPGIPGIPGTPGTPGTPEITPPALKITRRGGITLIRFAQPTLDRPKTQLLTDRAMALVKRAPAPRLLISFAGVREVSSAILGSLIAIDKQVKQKQGLLCITDLSPEILQVLQLMHLDQVLKIHSDVSEAVSALRGVR